MKDDTIRTLGMEEGKDIRLEGETYRIVKFYPHCALLESRRGILTAPGYATLMDMAGALSDGTRK